MLKNSFYRNITFNKFLNAYYKASSGKLNKSEVLEFYLNLEVNLISLMNDISTFKYKCGKYREFIIYEPKKRVIRSLPFIDRVVEVWYVENIIKPYFVPRFIYDNYACLENKGYHKAIYRLQSFMKSMRYKYDNYYVIKFDIKHFFESIDKDILFSILRKYIKDKYVLRFSYNIIYSNKKEGLPIGNYTSQYFANIYMNELDHYLKDNLKLKYYIKYMDDFVILVKDKYEARYIYDLVEIFVNNKLGLSLNKKSCYYPSGLGCDFCGYIIFEDYILVRKSNKNNLKDKLLIDVSNLKNNYKSVAIITKDDNEAEYIYNLLKDDFDIGIITSKLDKYQREFIAIPFYLAKGLEFDSVIIYTDEENRYVENEKYFFYVSCTRAQHELIVYNN